MNSYTGHRTPGDGAADDDVRDTLARIEASPAVAAAERPLPAVLPSAGPTVPMLFAAHSERAARRLIEFFTAQIQNPNTRAAYARAVARFDCW